jgi:hypothetical protein
MEMRMIALDLESPIWLIKLDLPFERAAAIVVRLRKKGSSLLKLSYFSCNPIRKEYETFMTYLLHLIMLIVLVKWFLVLFDPSVIVSVNIASVGDVMKPIDPAIFSEVDVLFTSLQLFCSL